MMKCHSTIDYLWKNSIDDNDFNDLEGQLDGESIPDGHLLRLWDKETKRREETRGKREGKKFALSG